MGRRVFVGALGLGALGLGALGLGALGLAFGDQAQRFVGRLTSAIANASGSDLGALIPGSDRFRLYTVTGSYPVVKPEKYRLEVSGLAGSPTWLSLADLKALPRTEVVSAFQCVTGWRVPNVRWAGARLADLLEMVDPRGESRAVELSSYDGDYTGSLSIEQARLDVVLVAYEMLGAPVTVEHGGPVRLYDEPMYGYKSIKWLKTITLVREATPGYWEQLGYQTNAWLGASYGHEHPLS